MTTLVERAVEFLQRVRRGPQSLAGQRLLLILAALVFIGLSVIGYRSLPADREPIDVWLLAALIVIGGPAMLAATANEHRVLGGLCDVEIPATDAVRVTVVGAMANLLPLPGAVLVRSGDLLSRGVAARRVAASVTALGLVFVAVAAIAAAGAFALAGSGLAAAVAGLTGSVLLSIVAGLRRRSAPQTWVGELGRMVAVECVIMGVVVIRLMVVLAAIGVPTGLIEAVTLGAASVLSTAVAIFPGGLGLREAMSGLLGSLVGIDVATGIVASAVDRLTYLVSLGVVSLLALVRPDLRPTRQAAADDLRNNQM